MKVHVILTNDFDKKLVTEIKIQDAVCAVIDTIRATSTIAAMLGCGGNSIVIAENKKEAYSLKKDLKNFILCGEEKGLPPKGFDYGNSPLEISGIKRDEKNFILMTTNGTKSILKVKDSVKIYALSILNLYYVINAMINAALENDRDILLLCSGEKGKIAYDDAYTAGLAVKYILSRPYSFDFSDSAKLVLGAALSEFDINDALEKSCSARSLRAVGLGEDIAFLSQKNKFEVAPVLKTAILVNHDNKNELKFLRRQRNPKSGLIYVITNEQNT